jgi:hypothetical protein
MAEATRARTQAVKAQEAADLLKIEEAKPWQTRVEEIIVKIKKIIPEFKERSMCTICKRDLKVHTTNTVCAEAAWEAEESDKWLKDYHVQLVGTLSKIDNEDMLDKIKTMKEKRMRGQAHCKAFEGQLETANRRLATMEAFLEECQGDTRLAEEAETKIKGKYEENKEELIELRAQMVSFRKGSEVMVQGRRGSTAENETWRERDNPTHR